jgi:hypothetical protein
MRTWFQAIGTWLALVYSKANLLKALSETHNPGGKDGSRRHRALPRLELGAELKNRELKKPVRVLLTGGAYMLLFANAPRPTKDIDIFWLDADGFQRAYAPLRESV